MKWETISDLKGLKIGLTTGYFYGAELAKAEAEGTISVIRCVDTLHCLKMLVNGRIDLSAAEFDVGLHLLNTEFSPEEAVRVEPQSQVLHSKELFMLLTRKKKESEQLIELFNRGLRKLEVSGKVEQYWQESRRGDYIIKE